MCVSLCVHIHVIVLACVHYLYMCMFMYMCMCMYMYSIDICNDESLVYVILHTFHYFHTNLLQVQFYVPQVYHSY